MAHANGPSLCGGIDEDIYHGILIPHGMVTLTMYKKNDHAWKTPYHMGQVPAGSMWGYAKAAQREWWMATLQQDQIRYVIDHIDSVQGNRWAGI